MKLSQGNVDHLAAARDKLREAADLVQKVIDHDATLLQTRSELDLSQGGMQSNILKEFTPYVQKTLIAIPDIIEILTALYTPGDRLLMDIFGISIKKDGAPHLVEFPEYSENALWLTVEEMLNDRMCRVVKARNGYNGSVVTFSSLAEELGVSITYVEHLYLQALRILARPMVMVKIFPDIAPSVTKYAERICTLAEAAEAIESTPGVVRLEDANLSVRTYNVLRRGNVCTLNELADMPIDDILSIWNLGRRTLEEIYKALKTYLDIDRPELLVK